MIKMVPFILHVFTTILDFPGSTSGKEPTHQCTNVSSIPGWEDPLEKEMATDSGILAWRIPWTPELGELWSIRSQRIRHD